MRAQAADPAATSLVMRRMEANVGSGATMQFQFSRNALATFVLKQQIECPISGANSASSARISAVRGEKTGNTHLL